MRYSTTVLELAVLGLVAVTPVSVLRAQAAQPAQPAPGADIYIAPLAVGSDGSLAIGPAMNATARAGYDNQPAFLRDGSGFLFTSIREDAQADIYRYDLASKAITRVTSTPESEYSATPLVDGVSFSSVRVEADSTQRLWRFPIDGNAAPAVLLGHVKPVGYHTWIDDSTVAMFVLGEPPTLQLAKLRSTAGAGTYARDIGRGIQPVPGARGLVFVQRSADTTFLEELRFIDGRAGSGTYSQRRLARTLPGQDYFVVTASGELLAASGATLFRWSRDCRTNDGWETVGELGPGVKSVSRLALSPDGKWLAFVAEPAP